MGPGPLRIDISEQCRCRHFVGFTVRRFPSHKGGKLIIKPSAAAVRRFKRRLATEFRSLHGRERRSGPGPDRPGHPGLGVFYRTVVSSRVVSGLDDYLWKLCYMWATRSHPKKPKPWIVGRYVGRFHPGRADPNVAIMDILSEQRTPASVGIPQRSVLLFGTPPALSCADRPRDFRRSLFRIPNRRRALILRVPAEHGYSRWAPCAGGSIVPAVGLGGRARLSEVVRFAA